MRNSAYVLNLLSRVGSYLSIASINPMTPELTRSSNSIFDGNRTAIFWAMNLMSGAYSMISFSFVRRSIFFGWSLDLRVLAVGMVFPVEGTKTRVVREPPERLSSFRP